jgi:hypothetical protein
MPYATIDDVQRRMPQFQLLPTSKPSIESAQVFLDDCHAHFDAAMSNLGYVIPLTGKRALSQAREIVSQGTIARILYARGAALGTDAAFQSADRAQKQYDDALKALADPRSPAELSDAARTDDQTEKPGNELGGLLVDEDGYDIEPRITMSTDF